MNDDRSYDQYNGNKKLEDYQPAAQAYSFTHGCKFSFQNGNRLKG